MDQPIIVLIDFEARMVRLFGKITRNIPFMTAFILPSLISGQEVLYVSSIEAVQGEDVVNLMTQIITDEDQPQEKLYIRSKQEGYVRISEIKLTFSGPKDAKPIESYGWDLFEKSGTLRKLLLDDKVEILLESQAKALRKHRPDAKSKDKALDSILLNRSVRDVIENEDMFGFDGGSGDEVSGEEEVLDENQTILRDAATRGIKFGKDKEDNA